MSVSCAARIASFQFACTGDSVDETIRVPIWIAFRTQSEGGGHRAAIDHAAGGDHRHFHFLANERQQHHRRDIARVLEATALPAFDHEAIDTCLDSAQGCFQGRHDVEDDETGLF